MLTDAQTTAHRDQLLDQYDLPASIEFYRSVLSGGGYDIHYGVFQDGSESLGEAALKSTDLLADLANWVRPLGRDSTVLDLGSGFGGAAHRLAERFGALVGCFNISAAQNELNLARAAELGLADRVETTVGDFEHGLPADWTGAFDVVWSQDVLCHAVDRAALFADIRRCLKPGGVLAFSDVMRAEHVGAEQVRGFTERNAVAELGTPGGYRDLAHGAGLRFLAHWDLSHHLVPFFRRMVEQIDHGTADLVAKGVSAAALADWRGSVLRRIEAQEADRVISWGAFLVQRD